MNHNSIINNIINANNQNNVQNSRSRDTSIQQIINDIDSHILKKYKRTEKDIDFYNNLLKESNMNFYIIVQNLML